MEARVPRQGDFAFGATIVIPRRREMLHHGVKVDIGDRAFDLLLFLVESRHCPVGKDDIIARLWHERVVETNTVEAQVSALRRALGDDRSAIRTVSGRGYQFTGELLSQGTEADEPQVVRVDGAAFPGSALPAQICPIIGREEAVRDIRDTLETHRLITLVGAGGVGKTRLALEAARQSVPRFADGVFLVELAVIAATDYIPTTIAVALGFPPGDGTPSLDRLAASLLSRHMLVVLDNCEHLIDGAAGVAERLLHIAPRATVLATSREPLRVPGELVYRVPSLDCPPDDDCDSAREFGAMRLFEQRLGADARRGLDAATALRLESRICRQLDGIPLALELAAACVPAFGLKGVADRLENRFQILTHGARTALPRQQTLRATLDWSHSLLTDEQRIVLTRLSLFVGTFTLASAQEMASCTSIPPDSVVAALMQLVDKSLLSIAPAGGSVRYRLLESTSAYAREKLRASGTLNEWSARHARFFLTIFRVAEQQACARADVDWKNDYMLYLDDLRAAMQWCFSAEGDMALAVELTVASVPFLMHLALLQECLAKVDGALAWLSSEGVPVDERQMKLYAARGMCLLCHTVAASTSDAFESATSIAAQVRDPAYQLLGMWGRWMCHYLNGEYKPAIALAQRFHDLASMSSWTCDRLAAHRLKGMACLFEADLPNALAHLQRASCERAPLTRPQRMRFLYDEKMLSNASLALTLWFSGKGDQARRAALQSLDDARELDHPVSICYALSEAVCTLAVLDGDDAALEEGVASLAVETRRHSISTWRARTQMWQGLLALRAGDGAAYVRMIAPAMTNIGSKRFYLSLSPYITALAEALCRQGNVVEASEVIDMSVERAVRTGDICSLPELWRAKAEVLVAQRGEAAIPAAEVLLTDAIQMAEQHGFVSWQSRSALSLARLQHLKGDVKAALEAILPVTHRFQEVENFAHTGAAQDPDRRLPAAAVHQEGRERRH